MKVLVMGSCYSYNLGDGVLTECACARLRQHFPDAQIQMKDLWGREDFPAPVQVMLGDLQKARVKSHIRKWVYRYLKWDKQLSCQEYRLNAMMQGLDRNCDTDADLVVFAGGQMFMDDYALIMERCVQNFARQQIPMIFNACGVGEGYSEAIRLRLKAALNDPWVCHVSSRDDAVLVDRRYFDEQRTEVTFDPALWAGSVYGIEKDPNADTIGLGIMGAKSVPASAMTKFWIRMIRELERRQLKWKIFTNGDPVDVCMVRHIISKMPELKGREETCMAPVPTRPRELVQMIAQFRSLISFRLHSHIIAASLGVPTIAMVWDNKLDFFFEKIGHPERCCTVKAAPETVLTRLEQSEREGYPAGILDGQRHFADELLRNAVINAQKRMTL